ncbi:metallophosphoesterase family protein [Sulfitobacter sabulilitoris]|uniref:Metallophosphoesterase family protein n=1 Tax=Sulfitobacter sabulilitoris TaxID=2562655 RepID=A0A5S3PJE7_9RHOB|nr:metallophosphoesterase family protein [Sulfitobacter sabulilitoris]TMM54457.1 metallophosphoesterase family protein [Sulfitobacter sabulilitoris]
MKHLDLGSLQGRVALFGGPYSNLQATQALIARARAMGAAHLICTGDVVAYCADPVATVAAIRAAGVHVVAGNCEKQLAAGAPDCGCGFDAGSACDLLSAGWFGHANARVPAHDRDWMGGLPDILSFTSAGLRHGVIHGGMTDVARFIWPTSPEAEFAREWAAVEDGIGAVDRIVAGHCGIAFRRDLARRNRDSGPAPRRWINAGVIGMPAHDARRQTRFVLLDGAQATIHDLDYDASAAAAAMRDAGLTQGYDRALLSGLWPSEDVLPVSLRRSAGSRAGAVASG